MQLYTVAKNLYLYPTPGGAYFATASAEEQPSRRLLRNLLLRDTTPRLSIPQIAEWSGLEDEEKALLLLHHLQVAGWVQGLQNPLKASALPLEQSLPALLRSLTDGGKALLADSHGFYLATHGYPHEVAEELSALSAELSNLYERRAGLLDKNMGVGSSAWAIIDAAGNSRVGFWPLYIGNRRFVLVMSGVPHLNHPDFVQLVWILTRRYGH